MAITKTWDLEGKPVYRSTAPWKDIAQVQRPEPKFNPRFQKSNPSEKTINSRTRLALYWPLRYSYSGERKEMPDVRTICERCSSLFTTTLKRTAHTKRECNAILNKLHVARTMAMHDVDAMQVPSTNKVIGVEAHETGSPVFKVERVEPNAPETPTAGEIVQAYLESYDALQKENEFLKGEIAAYEDVVERLRKSPTLLRGTADLTKHNAPIAGTDDKVAEGAIERMVRLAKSVKTTFPSKGAGRLGGKY